MIIINNLIIDEFNKFNLLYQKNVDLPDLPDDITMNKSNHRESYG